MPSIAIMVSESQVSPVAEGWIAVAKQAVSIVKPRVCERALKTACLLELSARARPLGSQPSMAVLREARPRGSSARRSSSWLTASSAA